VGKRSNFFFVPNERLREFSDREAVGEFAISQIRGEIRPFNPSATPGKVNVHPAEEISAYITLPESAAVKR